MDQADASDRARGWLRRWAPRVGFHCLVWSLVALVLVPLAWPVMLSLNAVTVGELLDRGLGWWARGADPVGFALALASTPLRRPLLNSVAVATVAAAVTTVLGASGAYALDRFDFPGRWTVSRSVLVLLMVPQTVVVLPLFLTLRSVGLYDTYVGLVLAYVALTLPFTVWVLRPFFAAVPSWVEEAALVDGCTRLGAFVRAFLPAAKPAIGGAFAFAWVIAYNELFFAVLLLDEPAKFTLPVVLRSGAGDPGLVSVVAAAPMVVLFGILWYFFLDTDARQYVS